MTILLGAAFCSGSGKLICRALEVSQGCSCAPPRTRLHPGRDLGIEDDKAFLWHGGKPPWDVGSYGEKKKRKQNQPQVFNIRFPKGWPWSSEMPSAL